MTICGYSEEDFGVKLGDILSTSRPIHSIEHLKGRDTELTTIKQSLYAPGRHVFVYGDRGVGKSSLAHTAAYLYQSVDASPLFVSGSPDDTFASIVANVVEQALRRPRTHRVTSTESLSLQWRGIQWSAGQQLNNLEIISQIRTVGDAVEILKQIAARHSEKPIVVLDEFDTIRDPAERNKFAALLKQMGDQSVNLKFIFTGIGKSLDELVGAHQSAHRQLQNVELPRLGWEARREIVEAAAREFDLEIDDDVNWRIALISDGYPYYIHSITEKMLWAAFSSEEPISKMGWDLFHQGLHDAILAMNAELKKPYEKAVLHREKEFEDIVWSTADHEDLQRPINDMYISYKKVLEGRGREHTASVLDKNQYGAQLRKLKGSNYGAVLEQVTGRKGWYSYSEKMLRGYVRMQAQVNGIALTGGKPAPKQMMYVGNARSGSYGPSIPSGVRENSRISTYRSK